MRKCMVIFSKTYIVQTVTCENSTTIIIKCSDPADKLFMQKILIKPGKSSESVQCAITGPRLRRV